MNKLHISTPYFAIWCLLWFCLTKKGNDKISANQVKKSRQTEQQTHQTTEGTQNECVWRERFTWISMLNNLLYSVVRGIAIITNYHQTKTVAYFSFFVSRFIGSFCVLYSMLSHLPFAVSAILCSIGFHWGLVWHCVLERERANDSTTSPRRYLLTINRQNLKRH